MVRNKTALPDSNKTLHNAYKLAPLKGVTLPEMPPQRVLSESRHGHQTIGILVFWPLASQSSSLPWGPWEWERASAESSASQRPYASEDSAHTKNPLKSLLWTKAPKPGSILGLAVPRPWRQSIHSNYNCTPNCTMWEDHWKESKIPNPFTTS